MVQLNGGPYKIDDSVQSLIDYEYKLGLNRPEIWTGYAHKIDTLRNKVTKILINLKKEGKVIAGYGAPAKATTLMYHFGIGPDIIDFPDFDP